MRKVKVSFHSHPHELAFVEADSNRACIECIDCEHGRFEVLVTEGRCSTPTTTWREDMAEWSDAR